MTKNTIKVYDGETGADVTSKFDVAVTNGIITANLKSGFTKSLGDANNTQLLIQLSLNLVVTTASYTCYS